MKKLSWLIGIASLLGSAGYVFSYLIRWQWMRAGFAFDATISLLVVLGIATVMRKLGQLEERMDRRERERDHAMLTDLQATRPQRNHFAWLEEMLEGPNVFITIVIGGGAIVSGIAWLLGKIAEGTTTPAAEGALADRLGPLAFPPGGVVPATDVGPDAASSMLRHPVPQALRRER